MEDRPELLENVVRSPNHFLTLRLVGTRSNRDGYGALVRLTAGGAEQSAEAGAGGSYLSSSDPRVHFGLGGAAEAERIEIVWPSGTVQRLEHVRADQFLTVTEGKEVTGR
jgi:hypothetical protein